MLYYKNIYLLIFFFVNVHRFSLNICMDPLTLHAGPFRVPGTPFENPWRFTFNQGQSIPTTGPCQSWPPNNPHPLDWLYLSLSSLLSICSWCVVSALAPLSCGSRRIIQVDAAHWWWLRRDPPHDCKALWVYHNTQKALYKCIIHSSFIQGNFSI